MRSKGVESVKRVVKTICEEFGYEKAPRELCNRNICVSMSEARRLVRYVKLDAGEKTKRHG
jgi:hypothetical protein